MKLRSTTKKAKNIIRSEMLSYYNPKDYGTRSKLSAIDMDVKAVKIPRYDHTDYHSMKRLVRGGNFAIYNGDIAKMLQKIYGKETVSKLERQGKLLDAYSHLLAREYAEMKRKGQKGLVK